MWFEAAITEEAPCYPGNHHVFMVTSDNHLSVSLLLFFALYFCLNFRGFEDVLKVDARTAHRRTWTQQDIPVPRTGRQLFLYGKSPHPHPFRNPHIRQHCRMWHLWGQILFLSLYSEQLCQKSVKMLLFPSGSRMLEQTNKDVQRRIKKTKNETSYQNTNFSLWTEPLWFLISPLIAAFLHQITPRPPPPHFRVFSQDRVLFFIKRSEVIRLSFLRLRRILAWIRPFTIYLQKSSLITCPLTAVPCNWKPIPKCALQIFYFS